MSLRNFGGGVSAILGLAPLLAATATADEKVPSTAIVDGKRVPTLVEAVRVQAVQSRSIQPAQAAREAQARPWPRVSVRDLRVLEGFYELDDERETLERFLRFRGGLPDQGFPSGGYHYGYGYGAYRSHVRDYVNISEYERFRRLRNRHRREMEVRKVRLLSRHEKALRAGLRHLGNGDSARATVALTLAAKLNHGDPACRVHLAQARLAQGHYLEAGLVLRRALQLQPKLVYTDLHLQDYYASAGALAEYTDALARWVTENPARPAVHFLLGFLEFQRGNFEAAHTAFARLKKALPDDDLTREYLEITKPATR